MHKKIVFSLALLLSGTSMAPGGLSQQDIYDYWDFNTGSNGAWKLPTYSSGGKPTMTVGSASTSNWDPNYGYGYVSGKYDSGNGSMFASFKEGGDVTVKYTGDSRPTWTDQDGISISMLICNGNVGAWNSSAHGFYLETEFSNSQTGAVSRFHYAFVPEEDHRNMKFQTNMPGDWSGVNVVMPLMPQDKLVSLVLTLSGGSLFMYLDGTLLLTCGAAVGNTFDFNVLNSVQIGGPAPAGSEFDGLRVGQAGSFVVDELAIWKKALNADEVGLVRDNEIVTLPAPEPSSALLSCIGVAAFALRRRRGQDDASPFHAGRA